MAKRRKKSNFKKNIWILIIIIIIVLIGSSIYANHKNQSNSKILNQYLEADMNTQDLSQMTDSYSFEVAGNTQQGLLSRTKNSSPKAGLAKSWNHSPNGLTWTFHLRKNLKWSNGDPLTASDFVYGWRRTVKPKTASQYAYIYSGIKNADEINSGKNKNLKSLGISAPDKNTVVVSLSHPMPQFENLMSFPVFFAQDQKQVSKWGKNTGTSSKKQVYSGPYKFVGWNGSNKNFKLRPNKHYWNQKAIKNQGVNFQVITDPTSMVSSYRKGNLDTTTLETPSQVRKYKNSKNLKKFKSSQSVYLEYNESKVPALKNLKIRQALNLATDRKGISKNVMSELGTPAKGFTPSGLAKTASGDDFAKAASKQTNYKYNISKAKKLFAQGMKEAGQKKLTLEIEADTESATAKPMLDNIQQEWNKLPGLNTKEHFVSFKQRLQDAQNHNFQVINNDWIADYAEPTTFLGLLTTGSPNNNGKWSNREYDKNYKLASSNYAMNNQKRISAEINAEKIINKEAPIDPIYWGNVINLIKPKVHNLHYFSSGTNYYFWQVKLRK